MTGARLLALALYAALGRPLPTPPLEERPARPVVVVRNHDGDVFTADVLRAVTTRAGHEYRDLETEDIRILGLDAPETYEVGGPEATAALADLLRSGRVWIRWNGKESLGRLLCDAWIERPGGEVVDLAAAMRALGHDVPRDRRVRRSEAMVVGRDDNAEERTMAVTESMADVKGRVERLKTRRREHESRTEAADRAAVLERRDAILAELEEAAADGRFAVWYAVPEADVVRSEGVGGPSAFGGRTLRPVSSRRIRPDSVTDRLTRALAVVGLSSSLEPENAALPLRLRVWVE